MSTTVEVVSLMFNSFCPPPQLKSLSKISEKNRSKQTKLLSIAATLSVFAICILRAALRLPTVLLDSTGYLLRWRGSIHLCYLFSCQYMVARTHLRIKYAACAEKEPWIPANTLAPWRPFDRVTIGPSPMKA